MNKSKDLIGLVVSGVIVVAAPFIGVLITTVYLNKAFQQTASVDVTKKAQVLATGISESMNGAAIGLGVSCLALIPTVVFAVRVIRGMKAK